jgi:hypothetical protein
MLHSRPALRGLHILAVLALTSCAGLASVGMGSTATGFTGPFNPIAPDGSFFANGWRFENYGGLNPFTTVPAELSYSLSLDKQTLTLVVKSPAGTVSAGKSLNSFSYVNGPNFGFGTQMPPGPLSYDWSVVFSEDVVEGELGFPQSAYDTGTRNLNFNANTPYTGHVDSADNRGLYSFSGWTPTSDNVVTCTITITNLTWTVNTAPIHTVALKKGDVVPGVTDATFTSLGVPAISDEGLFAILGKWKSPTGSGTGIFSRGALIAKVGDEVPSGSGVTIKALKDPVVSTFGLVTFPATLTGTGITSLNDAAILSNAPGGTLVIMAQEGTQVPDAPAGALWKSFSSGALPGGGGGVLILGFMQQGPGGITKTNDNGLWATDAAGALHLVLQEGTTQIAGKTVKSFKALKTSSGSPGQTRAFDARKDLVANVVFTDGFQALVHRALP